jgi:hypothetical protein
MTTFHINRKPEKRLSAQNSKDQSYIMPQNVPSLSIHPSVRPSVRHQAQSRQPPPKNTHNPV